MGGDELATKVTAETLARGSERVGEAQRKATSYLADARDAAALSAAYREGWLAVKHQATVEKQVIRSSKVLYVDPAAAEKKLAPVESAIDKVTLAVHEETRAMYALAAGRVQGPARPASDPALTDAERVAARTVVEPTAPAGGRGAGGGRGAAATGPAVPQHMNAELTILINQRRTVLEIRDFLSAEFEPLPLDTLMAVLKAREASGALKLVAQPEKPADAKKPTGKN